MKLKILAIVALGVVGVGAAFVAVGGLPASAASTAQYLTSAATTADVTNDVAATGTVATTASYGLAFGTTPHLAGDAASNGSTTWTVTGLKTKVGDVVSKGAVLATADTADLERQLADATNALRVAKLQLATAQDTLDGASGTSAIRQARIGVYNAEGQVSNADATRKDLRRQIANATLKAPIDGVVTAVNITEGLEAPSGDAIVLESTDLQVTADVVESDLSAMKLGQTATVTIAAVGADIIGTVSAIAPTANSSSSSGSVVSYPVTVSLKGAPDTVRAGMTADITITIDSATGVLTVPATALRGTAGSYSVLVMGADGQPVARAVEVGLVTNSLAEIKSGLTAGEMVVTGLANAQTTTPNGGFGGGFGGGVAVPVGGNGRFRVQGN